VIEHVTLPKSELWACRDGRKFREASIERQRQFAAEIRRLGKRWFVQTPAASFPIESHTWLPFFGYLPRRALLPMLRVTNRFWIKGAEPDFNLLSPREMQELFPGGRLQREKKFGLTKSIMMVRDGAETS
jgi:hypothetical protein